MVLVMTSRVWPPADPHSPAFGDAVAADYAAKKAVCVRPLVREVTDRVAGATQRVVIPCGSTVESTCAPCADKARRVRMQQCAEGWHLVDDPLPDEDESDFEDEAADRDEDGIGNGAQSAHPGSRRVRSTK